MPGRERADPFALITLANVTNTTRRERSVRNGAGAVFIPRRSRELTDKALRRGIFHSVPDLIASIQEYIDAHNDGPRPYMWTATTESILAKVVRDKSRTRTHRPRKSQLNPGHTTSATNRLKETHPSVREFRKELTEFWKRVGQPPRRRMTGRLCSDRYTIVRTLGLPKPSRPQWAPWGR
jgi:hypothetical protein